MRPPTYPPKIKSHRASLTSILLKKDPIRRSETRKIPIPPNRMSALKANWTKMYDKLLLPLPSIPSQPDNPF